MNQIEATYHRPIPAVINGSGQASAVAALFAEMGLQPTLTFRVPVADPDGLLRLNTGEVPDTGGMTLEHMVRNTYHNGRNLMMPLHPDVNLPATEYVAWPLPNVMLGVRASGQRAVDMVMPVQQQQLPAALRYVIVDRSEDQVELPRICACGCKEPLTTALRSVRLNPGYLNAEQAQAAVTEHAGPKLMRHGTCRTGTPSCCRCRTAARSQPAAANPDACGTTPCAPGPACHRSVH